MVSRATADAASPDRSARDRDDEDEDDVSSDDDLGGDESGQRKRARTSDGPRPMSVSCETCKQRKVKCDRGQPRCGWCVRNGQVCEFKERKKPGLRAGYGRQLEARLDSLEGALSAQQTLLQQLAKHFVPPASLDRGDDSVLPRPELREGTAVWSTSSAVSPAVASETYTASNPPVESPSLNIVGSAPSSTTLPTHGAAVVSEAQDFPPYDLLYALTDLFFRHINTWCPILHRRTTLAALFGTAALEEADRILLHAIVATSLRFSTDSRLTDTMREQYHSLSKQKVLLYGLENSSVKALQALVILALDIVGSSNGPPGWNLLALITRSVVQLGLAVETTSSRVAPIYPSIYTLRAMVLPEPKSFIEDESRRRLFWVAYLLDRYATIATAFEFALDDKEIDRRLPCRDDFYFRDQSVETRWFRPDEIGHASIDRTGTLGPFSHYVEIVGILSQVHQFLKRPVDISTLPDVEQWQMQYRQLDRRLSSWKFALPSEYGNMSRLYVPNGGEVVIDCMWIMLHATYHTTVIRLHSSAAYPTTRSPIFAPSFAASQRCLTAAEDICALCSHVRGHGMLAQLGPPFAFSLWVAARLLLVHGSTIDRYVSTALAPLVETLREQGAHWPVAGRYAALLQRVIDEYGESARADPSLLAGGHGGPNPGHRPPTPDSVRILADMRRCAFDLDFLISRQPKPAAAAVAAGAEVAPPLRTPAPNELEYLDVFDFFNLPRLPEAPAAAGAEAYDASVEGGGSTANEFNITNFFYDANVDWLGETSK